jgi:hypothetical protein
LIAVHEERHAGREDEAGADEINAAVEFSAEEIALGKINLLPARPHPQRQGVSPSRAVLLFPKATCLVT